MPNYDEWYTPKPVIIQPAKVLHIDGKEVEFAAIDEATLKLADPISTLNATLDGQGIKGNLEAERLLDQLLAHQFAGVDIPRVKAARPDIYAHLLKAMAEELKLTNN